MNLKRTNFFTFFIFLFLTLQITIITASNEDLIYESEQIRTNLEINSKIILSQIGTDYSIAFATANLTLIPIQNQNQQVLTINYDPMPSQKTEDYAVFKWENPLLKEYSYGLTAEISTKVNRNKIKQKPTFPITNLAEEYKKYTLPTKNIDSNDPQIIEIATKLTQGEDDQYVIVNKMVTWIKDNVNYSLDTITAEASQPASWVIRNKYGVCDEITSVFIAMARSVGIPARYMSGVAYTNWNLLNNWGPHAWAEVYYPGTGWVAYDITYNEFGYVDATHIILKESLDSNDPSTNYEWKGRNVELKTQKLEIKTKLIDKTGTVQPQIKIITTPLKQEIRFGSYNVIEAEIQNLQDYYVSEEIMLAKVKEMNIINDIDRQIVLKPGETKKIYWLIQIIPELENKFIYTIPITVYSAKNITGNFEIETTAKAKMYSQTEMQQYIQSKTEEQQKTYSQEIDLNCETKQQIALGETAIINCTITNKGNTYIQDLNTCLEQDCKKIDLPISKITYVSYETKPTVIGEKDYTIKSYNSQVSKTTLITTMVLDKPNIEITNITYNNKIKFGETLKLNFLIKKTSLSIPLKLKIIITQGKTTNGWKIDELPQDQEFTISFDTKTMVKQNDLLIKIDYEDDKQDKYLTQEQIRVEVQSTGFMDSFKMWINKIANLFG